MIVVTIVTITVDGEPSTIVVDVVVIVVGSADPELDGGGRTPKSYRVSCHRFSTTQTRDLLLTSEALADVSSNTTATTEISRACNRSGRACTDTAAAIYALRTACDVAYC